MKTTTVSSAMEISFNFVSAVEKGSGRSELVNFMIEVVEFGVDVMVEMNEQIRICRIRRESWIRK